MKRRFQRRPEKIMDGERLLLCTRCNKFLPADRFHLDARSPSKRTNYCYPCRSEVNKAYSLKRAEKRDPDRSAEAARQTRRQGDAPPIPSLAKMLGA